MEESLREKDSETRLLRSALVNTREQKSRETDLEYQKTPRSDEGRQLLRDPFSQAFARARSDTT